MRYFHVTPLAPHYFDLSCYPKMLKSNFFRVSNFNIFYSFGARKFAGKATTRTNCTEKNFARNEKFFARNEKNFYL